MKQILNIYKLLFFYFSFNCVDCHQSNGSAATTYQLPKIDDDNLCPLWHSLNPTTNLCECYTSPSFGNNDNIVRCTEQGIELRVGYCMTYEEQDRTIYIAPCAFSGNFSTTGNRRYIELPVQNASELNDYMCGQ